MQIERDDLYFEPRVVNDVGIIRWYGVCYQTGAFLSHTRETVYIRDDGEHLYVYSMTEDDMTNERSIHTTFSLISKIKKRTNNMRYGKVNKQAGAVI